MRQAVAYHGRQLQTQSTTMASTTILKFAQIPVIQRGGGIQTVPLVTRHCVDEPAFTTGISTYPNGQGAPLHSHNCPEQVTLLDGVGEVEIEGVVTPLTPMDSTYIPAHVQHAFRNTGDGPMTILWIYSTSRVTRTFAGSGREVEHLSAEDLMGTPDPTSKATGDRPN